MSINRTSLCCSAVLTLILSITGCGGADKTQTTAAPATSAVAVTSAGTDFYLTLPDHLCVSEPALCNNLPVSNKLLIAAATATSGEIVFNNVRTPFTVAAGGQTVITLDPAVVLTANERIEARAIHLTALSPVSVHVMSENATSADGYLALPTPGLGTKYYVMSRASSRYTGSEFAIAATQDSTAVTITPTAAGASKPAGVAFIVVLNSGETYQFANPANADMTGTLISADKAIAVFSGHRCADVTSGVGYCDYLVEQLPDVSLWGKTFHTAKFSERTRYSLRVIASQNNTTFTTVPTGLIGTLNAGQYVDLDMSGTAELVANNPVLLAQFIRGYSDDLAAKGDPSMVLVTPAEMGMTDATFAVYGLAGTTGAYLNIVAETPALASLTLDNVAVNQALFTPIGGSSIYSLGTIPVVAGVHTLQGSGPHNALVYDYGIKWNAVSYAYPAARKLSPAAAASSPALPGNGCEDDDDHDHDGHHHHVPGKADADERECHD